MSKRPPNVLVASNAPPRRKFVEAAELTVSLGGDAVPAFVVLPARGLTVRAMTGIEQQGIVDHPLLSEFLSLPVRRQESNLWAAVLAGDGG